MNKKLAATLSGGAVVLLALSGCGNDDAKVNDWAKGFCDKVQPQRKAISDANASIVKATSTASSPDDVKKVDSAAFQSNANAYAALASAVKSAGAPPVDDGAKTQQAAEKELDATSAAYAQLKKQVDALETKDQAKFAQQLGDVSTQLGKIGSTGDSALRKLQSGDLGTAMAKQPGCKSTPSASGASTAS
ncbi:small secreted protein [Streptomyces fuscigenes]|uniref:small secreted protein n=1 Tax=Streptomyces fuscigenes TaxID=1528880 RepID=UPI001F3A56CF|nr:small secreted protein [Streptomyces fuscigenes]MCF3962283.1 small secreted protein [Streptomyces fuscigenes]